MLSRLAVASQNIISFKNVPKLFFDASQWKHYYHMAYLVDASLIGILSNLLDVRASNANIPN